MRFLKSFKYAFRGIIYCINNERNMRIHAVAGLYVFVFSFFFGLSRIGYAVLFLTVALVWMTELFNTVAEELSDLVAPSFNPVVRIVKDMASGSVLVCAGFSVFVGICLFWRPESFAKIAAYFAANPAMLVLLAAVTAASVVFVVLGPLGIRDRIRFKKQDGKDGGPDE